MTVLTWDSDPVSSGLERVVLFPSGTPGVPWNGFTAVDGVSSGGSTTLYFDGKAFANYAEIEPFAATVEALTYPEVVEELEQPPYPIFGMSWRETTTESYRIHLVWDAIMTPTSHTTQTRSGDVTLSTFGWDISTKTRFMEGLAPMSHMILEAEATPPAALSIIEQLLYGSEFSDSHLPAPQEILEIFWAFPHVKITDNGDGTFTVEADEDHIQNLGDGLYAIESGGIQIIDADTFTITTW